MTTTAAARRRELPLVRLLLRRHRGLLLAWTGLLVVLTGVTTSAYQTTYDTAKEREAATRLAQHDSASTVLYGVLGGDRPAHMFVWEIGTFATILTAILAVVAAVAMTRAPEEDGTVELLRGSGVPPDAPLRAALVALAVAGAGIAVGCGLAVGVSAGRVDGITWPGAVLFGAVLGATFLATAYLTVAVAQVAPTTTSASTASFAVLGLAFVLRAAADTQHLPWLNWLSVLGLRAVARPFAGDRWWAILPMLAAAVVVGSVAQGLARRREFGAGLVTRRDRRVPRQPIGSGLALTARLARGPAVRWAVAVACLGTAFAAMGSGAIDQARRGDLGGFLGDQVGHQDPLAGFLGYIGTLAAIATCAFVVLSVLAARRDETGGLTDLVLSSGVRRWAPLAWRVGVTWGASLVVLLAAGGLAALVVPFSLGGDDAALRAFAVMTGQWPAAVAVTGWAAAVVGLWPRRAWLAWVPLLVSAVLVLLGGLLGVSGRVQSLGVFGHVPDVAATDRPVAPLVLLVALGVAGAALGAWGTARRDISTA